MASFRKATIAGTKALTCLYAESGGGKTLSALLLARGLVGPAGRIAMIDTENRRGELYADDPRIGGYDVMQLGEPFSPKRYMDAIDDAEAEGYDALVIDSISHEWEGVGGVLDMAVEKAGGGQPQFGHWKEPKTQHKHLIAKLMRCKAHVIVCARAQYKSRQIAQEDYAKFGIESRAKSVVIRDDFQSPIQEERFIFEMTVHLYMSNQHPGVPIITKCPEMLLPAFEQGQPISVETGRRMAAFYDRGAPANEDAEAVFAAARIEAAKGTDAYAAWFAAQPVPAKRELANSGQHDKNKATAAEADQARQGADETPESPKDNPGYTPPNFDSLGGATPNFDNLDAGDDPGMFDDDN